MSLHDASECTKKCKSTIHGDIITAAISKRSILDAELCSYINYICCNCEIVQDSCGRTALHVAASCGRLGLVRWLVQSRHANINARDRESGYTSLQRAVFYGKIHVAIELIKLGASLTQLDNNSLTFMEHAMKDGIRPDLGCRDGELYAWGSNSNNGLGPQQSRSTPQIFDGFHKENSESVQQICINKFHSVIVSSSGKVYSCGHGQGGRLGLGGQQTVISPKRVVFPETNQEPSMCIHASISRDHSIFLQSDGSIFTCGLNTHHVLGVFPPPTEQLVPKPIKQLQDIKGVCAQRYHSVAWGLKHLYTWGLNAGQLGHKLDHENGDKYVISPKLVNAINIGGGCIKSVAASDGATAVCTDKGDVYILHEYQCRKIASRQLNIVEVCIIGGKLNAVMDKNLSLGRCELKVAALTNTGNLLLWQESDPHLCRCIFTLGREIVIRQMMVNFNGVLLVSMDGEAFQGKIRPRKKVGAINVPDKKTNKSPFHKFLDKEDCISVKLEKFAKIHRALSISSDANGNDYCVIQAYPYCNYQFTTSTQSEMQHNLGNLLAETDEHEQLHDVVFKVGTKKFPAHRFIVASKCAYLEKIVETARSKDSVTIEHCNEEIFEQFLKFLYTGHCDLLKIGELKVEKLRHLCDKKSQSTVDDGKRVQEPVADKNLTAFEYYNKKKPESNNNAVGEPKARNPVRMLHELAKKFRCTELQNALSNLDMNKYMIRSKSSKDYRIKATKFDINSHPSLCDVEVKGKDGKAVKAHRCILSARLEYFRNMFSMRWGSETCVNLPCPKSTLVALLEFIYTDNLSGLENTEMEHLFRVLILADQLFVLRLKEQCEWLLSNLLTLKNTSQILAFAHVYNAQQLKLCCLRFISDNLPAFLESRLLDDLDEEILKDVDETYFKAKSEIACRVITPYSTAVSDEEVAQVHAFYPVDVDLEVEKMHKTTQKRRSRQHKMSLSDKHISESESHLDSVIQFPDAPEYTPKDKNMPSRLKAIHLAQQRLQDTEIEFNFTKLSFNDPGTSIECDFPELNSPPSHNFTINKTPSRSKLKLQKVSQKERKRLLSESNSPVVAESPKSPWKITAPVVSPESSPSGMGAIISDEKKQKENLVKITSKLLLHNQLEDRAIDDLHKFYNTDNFNEEIILIERVSIGNIASPVWVPRHK